MTIQRTQEILKKELVKAGISDDVSKQILNIYVQKISEVNFSLIPKHSNNLVAHAVESMVYASCAAFSVCLGISSYEISFSRKSHDSNQVVSLADTTSSAVIHSILMEENSEIGYIDEELGVVNPEAEFVFIVDPLDGSASWILGIEEGWAVGIALHQKTINSNESGVVASVISSPRMNDGDWLLIGVNKQGCVNAIGDKQTVNVQHDINAVGLSLGHKDLREQYWVREGIDEISKTVMRMYVGIDAQHSGSWVAQGKLHVWIRGQQPSYDIAPVIGLVEAAGGTVMLANGNPAYIVRDTKTKFDYVCFNGQEKIRNWVMKLLKKNE